MRSLGLSFLIFFLVSGCVVQSSPKATQKSSAYSQNPCEMNESIEALSDPSNIEELIALINVLPKPLDSDCLLKSLKRPLYVNASASTLSVQPATNAQNPRIFIFKGDLIITIVPNGDGSNVLEFSELKHSMRSIKGELYLPILGDVTGGDAFRGIITNAKTSCSGCHSLEQSEYLKDGVQVYSSLAIKPDANRDVHLDNLRYELYLCEFNGEKNKRCSIYESLLSHGEVLPQDFPSDMLTFLESLQRGL